MIDSWFGELIAILFVGFVIRAMRSKVEREEAALNKKRKKLQSVSGARHDDMQMDHFRRELRSGANGDPCSESADHSERLARNRRYLDPWDVPSGYPND